MGLANLTTSKIRRLTKVFSVPRLRAPARQISTWRESNRLRSSLNEGRASLGAWQMLPGANVSRLLARSGVDWVLVDCEHGNLDDGAMHDAVPAIASMGVSPVVRVADLQGWMIKRALDSGAHGIIVPMLRTPGDAREVVRLAKFPPFGIETREALDSISEIASVEGVDVLFVGPFDLGNNIGHPIVGGVMDQELEEAIAKVLSAGKAAGKKVGIYCSSGEQARTYRDQGFDMMNVLTDYSALRFAASEQFSIASGGPRPEAVNSY